MSNMELITSVIVTLLQILCVYFLLPIFAFCFGILAIVVAIAAYLLWRKKWK